jgi:hypothetical protein
MLKRGNNRIEWKGRVATEIPMQDRLHQSIPFSFLTHYQPRPCLGKNKQIKQCSEPKPSLRDAYLPISTRYVQCRPPTLGPSGID